MSVCEGGDDGEASSAGEQTAEQTAEQAVKTEAAADSDAKPSTTTTGDFIKAVSVYNSVDTSHGFIPSVFADFKEETFMTR